MTRTITSTIAGAAVSGAPGGTLDDRNPAQLDDVVADGRARRRRRRSSRPRRPRAPRSRAGPTSRRRSAAARSPTSAGSSRPTPRRSLGWSPARSASRTPRRSARSARSSTPATSSSARAAGSTARPCRARCRTRRCSPSATRSASSRRSPPATSRSRSRPGTSCPALLCGNAVVWKPADYSPACGEALYELFVRGGGLPDGVLNLVMADGERPSPGCPRRSTTGWSTRSASPDRARSARRSASSPGATCSRPAWSSAARTRWSSRRAPTSTSPPRRRCSPGSARRASAAPRSAP